ncbi:CPBP family intramembrane glutamic endopeptidase [Sphingopyxis sp. P1IMeth2]|uniref:CPBP family intramembrane glutamic endopeptidase n=1 Tax=Sphingopyxis sp. P1IMeth2 TaxID=1892848 RepID=UPI0021B3188B|nr:CPBP family intramembrane glutamic endopeptidase [Sphingopyxis sp. P1IMeth2]
MQERQLRAGSTAVRVRTATFIGVTFSASWLFWFVASPAAQGQQTILLATIYMFGPLVGALVTARAFDRDRTAAMIGWRWRFSRWWIVGWLLAGALALGAALASSLLPGVTLQSASEGALAAVQASGAEIRPELAEDLPSFPILVVLALLGGIIPNAIAGFGEEAGWRGYLWSVVRHMGFWKASLLVGTIWGLWHAPLIIAGHNYGAGYWGFPWTGVLMMTSFCIALSPVMGFLRDRTGSAIPAAIFHGTINSMSGISLFLLDGANIWSLGIIGFPGLAILAVVTAGLLLLRNDQARSQGD